MCVSNAPCIGGRELSYQGSCWPWGSEEPCQPTKVLISDIYGNVTCACKCVDEEDGSCHPTQECEDDVPYSTFSNTDTFDNDHHKLVPIPTVVYHRKYVKKILCSSDPLLSFCDDE